MTLAHATLTRKQFSEASPSGSRPGGELARPASPTVDVSAGPATLPDKEYVLSAIRCATLRARLAAAELDTIGVALRHNLVSAADALAWLHDVDLLDHVIYRPITDAH